MVQVVKHCRRHSTVFPLFLLLAVEVSFHCLELLLKLLRVHLKQKITGIRLTIKIVCL